MACVYMHTVINNGKKYIGQCSGDPKVRWGSNGYRYKGLVFYNAIKKYGWNNIAHEILIDNLTQEEADYYEKYYISLYKTTDRNFGYNVAPGGFGNPGLSGESNPNSKPVICLETGQRWPCSSSCAKELNVNIASLQESLYHGYKCKGKHYRYEEDDNYQKHKEPNGVLCVETGEIWTTVKECAKELGVHSRSVARYCNGLRKPSNGLTYQYCVV